VHCNFKEDEPGQRAACLSMQLSFQLLFVISREIPTSAEVYVARFCSFYGKRIALRKNFVTEFVWSLEIAVVLFGNLLPGLCFFGRNSERPANVID
jgi:hypothetical protein